MQILLEFLQRLSSFSSYFSEVMQLLASSAELHSPPMLLISISSVYPVLTVQAQNDLTEGKL